MHASTDHDFWLARGDDAGEPRPLTRAEHDRQPVALRPSLKTTAELLAVYGPVPGVTA